jgi:hypothetical protein
VSHETLQQFQRGQTTYTEVVQALGPPTAHTLHADGTRQLVYSYTQSQANAANFLPVVGTFLAGAASEHTIVQMDFDAQGLLTHYTATEGSTAVGTGLSSGARQKAP